MDANFRDFYKNVDVPENEARWKRTKTYSKGTPDEATLSIELSEDTSSFDKELYLNVFNNIIHGCDPKREDNPITWKFGGKWPPYKAPVGECRSQYKFFLNSIFIHGGSWATADYGQETLKKRAGACIGSTPTSWKF
ncbi:uncharacterized protein B0I36DRAFT_369551 [Microdochium trichocladiopsis]|uniref:Uncharacterized protein n=1 Tax=Microdochium trichocladiopsis TaxID=1682393 RepID=A0A9P8XSB2_9PEZI|nr:uncharacterized protein B0I36DRAFT_369551 [Microdochium trichocladiopsis]KAH7014615.1 hypothetical protein B0I36DRAFT_369551 [Microdochium trichocladiopsis]